MAEPERSLPEGWSEVSHPDHIIEKYDPRPVTLFTHEEYEVGVHVLPLDPVAPHMESHDYRVGYLHGGENEFDHIEPIARTEDFEDGLEVARTFMTVFDEASGDVEERVDAGIEAAREDELAAALEEWQP